MLQIARITTALIAFLAFLGGCGTQSQVQTADDRPRVVATTAMIGDAVKAVGGDRITVDVLMGPGVDPHQFRATRADTAKLARAEVIFANGLFLEAKLLETLQRMSTNTSVVLVGERLDASLLLEDKDEPGMADPHLWMDPVRWAMILPVIEYALSELLPEHRAEFASNAEAYKQQLDDLHQYAANAIATIPEERRLLVTAHDAFGYMADRYGIEVEGIQGLSTESESGLNRIESLVNEIVRRQIEAVFVETSVSDRNVQSLIQGARAKGHTVRIGGELFSDAMGKPGTYEGTYIGMIDHNVTTIVRALGGEAPRGGMLGKLAGNSGDGTTQ